MDYVLVGGMILVMIILILVDNQRYLRFNHMMEDIRNLVSPKDVGTDGVV